MRKWICVLGLVAMLGSKVDAFLGDENAPQSNRILWGGGLRDPLRLGLEFQRKIIGQLSASASLGFFPLDGFHASLGAAYLWRDNKRFRPLILTGLSYLSGMGPLPGKVMLNGEESKFRIEDGIFWHGAGGFQFRIWKGLGLQYHMGWRQVLAGGGYTLMASTDLATAKDALDSMTGSGILFGARGFWEF